MTLWRLSMSMSAHKVPCEGIAVDAAHSVKNRLTEIQGVDLATGETVFYANLGNQTVNIGEFVALVEGVKYVIENKIKPPIVYSDSTTALTWYKEKYTASKKRNKLLFKAEIYLKVAAMFTDKVEVRHWNSSVWGENPADFGNKK